MVGNEVKIVMPVDEVGILEDFLSYSIEMLSEVEDLILRVEDDGDGADDTIRKIFRSFHTIKGTAGFVKLISVERLGHRLETLLGQLQQGEKTTDPDIIDCLLSGVDNLTSLLKATTAACQNKKKIGENVSISFLEPDISSVLEWLENETKKKGPAVASSPPIVAPVMPLDYEYSFPEELIKDFIEESETYLVQIEDILLGNRTDPDFLDALLRGLHTFKGNAGILISHIQSEAAREVHIVNKMRLIAHDAESLVQKRRDVGSALLPAEIELLIETHDCLHKLFDGFINGENFGGVVDDLLLKLKSADEEKRPAPLKEALALFESGLAELQDRKDNAAAALDQMRLALEKIGSEEGQTGIAEKAEEAGFVVAFMISDWPVENVKPFLFDLEEFARACRKTLEELPIVVTPVGDKGKDKKKAFLQEAPPQSQTSAIKVPQERLDNLMNQIGELLVSKNALEYLTRQIATEDGRPDIAARVKDLSNAIGRIGNELQASIMAVRMMPVGHVFGKFPRLIRDLSRKLKKEIDFETDGNETELDKTVLDAISDPLLHLIRNSADHGLESAETRKKSGKPEVGSIRLQAANVGQSVRIEIKDDGQGIDTAKIRAKALKNDFIDEEMLNRMSDQQIKNLIFAPGMSTAESVTEVSGRGVGMDVVLKGISAAGGRVELFSEMGQGTTVVMHLPLTLAVSRGLEVEVCGERYYLPLEYVRETMKIDPSQLHYFRNDCLMVRRGEVVPVRHLGRLLDLPEIETTENNVMYSLVILNLGGKQVAYKVDRFLREGEYVLKPLPGPLGEIAWVCGSMITPTGKVILVLNPLKLQEWEDDPVPTR